MSPNSVTHVPGPYTRPGDPVRRGFSVNQRRLWNTGSPAFAGDDRRFVIARSEATKLLPTPSACPEPLAHVLRGGCRHAHRLLVFRNRNPDLARMQMQPWLTKARTVAVNVVADDRPALARRMHAQLMGAAGEGFHRQPGEAVTAAEHLPMGDRLLSLGIGFLPPAALGIQAPERQVNPAF